MKIPFAVTNQGQKLLVKKLMVLVIVESQAVLVRIL